MFGNTKKGDQAKRRIYSARRTAGLACSAALNRPEIELFTLAALCNQTLITWLHSTIGEN